jgi:hypothetical protein
VSKRLVLHYLADDGEDEMSAGQAAAVLGVVLAGWCLGAAVRILRRRK